MQDRYPPTMGASRGMKGAWGGHGKWVAAAAFQRLTFLRKIEPMLIDTAPQRREEIYKGKIVWISFQASIIQRQEQEQS